MGTFDTQASTDNYLNSLNARRKGANAQQLANINTEYQRVQKATLGRFGEPPSALSGGGDKTASRYKAGSFGQKIPSAMSIEDAYAQAKTRLDPAYQARRTNAGAVNQQQQALLTQRLNARGMAQGGMANQGALDTSSALQQALATIDTSYNADVATQAEALQQRDFENKRASYSDALSSFQANEGNRFNAATFNNTVERQGVADAQFKQNFDENARQFGMTYALQKAQDAWQKEQGEAQITGIYNGSPTLAKIAADRGWEIDKAQLALARASAARSASSRSSSSSGPRLTQTQQKNLQLDDLAPFVARYKEAGWDSEQVVYALMQETGGTAVSPTDVRSLVKSVYGTTSAAAKNDPYGVGTETTVGDNDLYNWIYGTSNKVGH